MERASLKRIVTFLLVLLSLSTVVMIYLSNLHSVAFDQDFYESKYVEFNIRSRFSDSVDLSNETSVLINYLESGDGDIKTDFFNEKEITHLREVRQLFRLSQLVLSIVVIISVLCVLLLIVFARKYTLRMKQQFHSEYFKRVISRLLIMTGAIVDGIALLFGFVALTFSTSFIRFHELFFKTDTWMLNPATDNLIRMFPQQFFYDVFTRIVLMSVIFATILLVIGFIMRLGRPVFMRKSKAEK